ncbi:MAG: LacI family DNA-binding transcriptional regulator [Spirochaetales bacterium]|uniref:LacI family DNA-binding transcriptional regulator n=1 Tax=Candidatus Thalassospirochaeta sargassi TaxID=3119039 RepID=A0AAJ1MLF4_9SPIO|nr:LacI family DNA-binding transcriptional regulator [Spirochaetales bacterium]
MKTTIKDIADKAGVSTAAVSLSINNKPGVSNDTRERVIEVAHELGYEPLSKFVSPDADIIIRFLKISRHGHTINKNHNYFIDAYVEGISATASVSGATVEVEAYSADEPLENIINKITDSPQLTGCLILGTELSEKDIKAFVATGKNIVFVDTYLDYISADFVDMNNTDAVYKLVNHLIGRGHKEIGMIKSSVNTRNFQLREKAFYQVMESLGLEINKDFIIDVDSTFDEAYSGFKEFLSGNPQLPTAFFAINDIIAMGCMRALQDKGYTVPDEVSIAAFDNLPMSEMVSPPLTTIDVSKREIGRTALDMLLHKASREISPPPRKTMIGGRLIKRESVKKIR